MLIDKLLNNMLPAAKAVTTLATNIIIGTFQGKIRPHTPTGCLRVYENTSPSADAKNLFNVLCINDINQENEVMNHLPAGIVSPWILSAKLPV